MLESIRKCIYNFYIDEPVTISSVVLDLLFSLILIIAGYVLNYRFKKKLKEEKRAKPLHRKGNVIEPIMRWYIMFSMIYFPYAITWMWIITNEILSAEWFINYWLFNILLQPVRIGGVIVGYNSFFVALIRYQYIVHQQKSNQWNFEKVGKLFQIASMAVPIFTEIMRIFSEYDYPGLKSSEKFRNCMAAYEGLNSTENMTFPPPVAVGISLQFLPHEVVDAISYIYGAITFLIFSNLIDGYMYWKIFQSIKRSA